MQEAKAEKESLKAEMEAERNVLRRQKRTDPVEGRTGKTEK